MLGVAMRAMLSHLAPARRHTTGGARTPPTRPDTAAPVDHAPGAGAGAPGSEVVDAPETLPAGETCANFCNRPGSPAVLPPHAARAGAGWPSRPGSALAGLGGAGERAGRHP